MLKANFRAQRSAMPTGRWKSDKSILLQRAAFFQSADLRIDDLGRIDLLRTFGDAINQQFPVIETGRRQIPAGVERDRIQAGKMGQNLVVNQRHVEPTVGADTKSFLIRVLPCSSVAIFSFS